MFRPTVRSEMKEWDGQAMHRFFRQQLLIWQIPIHFIKNIFMIWHVNRKRGEVKYHRLFRISERKELLAYGETQHVLFRGICIYSTEIRPFWKNNLRVCVLGLITFGERIKKIIAGERNFITGIGLHWIIRPVVKTVFWEARTNDLSQMYHMQSAPEL